MQSLKRVSVHLYSIMGIFQKRQNVSRLAMVAIDMYFGNKSTVSTPTTHSESSVTSGE